MGFKEAIIKVFNNYANFSGRARRSEYWYFFLFTGLVTGVLGALGGNPENGRNIFTVLSSLFSLAVFIPNLAVIWRRLHDIGKSGANYTHVGCFSHSIAVPHLPHDTQNVIGKQTNILAGEPYPAGRTGKF